MTATKESCLFLENDVDCSIGLYGGKPRPGDCLGCEKRVLVPIENGQKHFNTVNLEVIREKGRAHERNQAQNEDSADKSDVKKQSSGLGDTIAKATKAVGIKPCGKCQKRREKLNKMFPYKNTEDKSGTDQ